MTPQHLLVPSQGLGTPGLCSSLARVPPAGTMLTDTSTQLSLMNKKIKNMESLRSPSKWINFPWSYRFILPLTGESG